MSKKPHKYIVVTMIIAFGSLSLIGAFNFIVDPIGFWGREPIENFNLAKLQQPRFDRLIKAVELLKNQPEVLFLGTSRVQVGLEPKTLSNFGYNNVYNAALSAASLYETLAYLEHAIYNNSNLKIVVIGVSIDSFRGNKVVEYKNGFLAKRMNVSTLLPQDIIECLISMDITRTSLETLFDNIIKKEKTTYFQKNGARTDAYQYLVVRNQMRTKKLEELFSASKSQLKISTAKIDIYQEIVKICQEKNVKLITYIEPLHVCRLEPYDNENWDEFEKWKIALSELTPIWDFSGYNQITTEPVSYTMRYYFESSHYKKEVGNMILEQIFGNRKGFGVLLDKSKLTNQLEEMRFARDAWRNTHRIELIDSGDNQGTDD